MICCCCTRQARRVDERWMVKVVVRTKSCAHTARDMILHTHTYMHTRHTHKQAWRGLRVDIVRPGRRDAPRRGMGFIHLTRRANTSRRRCLDSACTQNIYTQFTMHERVVRVYLNVCSTPNALVYVRWYGISLAIPFVVLCHPVTLSANDGLYRARAATVYVAPRHSGWCWLIFDIFDNICNIQTYTHTHTFSSKLLLSY